MATEDKKPPMPADATGTGDRPKKKTILDRHQILERNVTLLAIFAFLVVTIGGIVQIAPLFWLENTIEDVDGMRPYTPLELAGRDIYIREGCVGCHSQMVRPFRHEMERYGDYSKPGETVYESPFLWGSKRTGPDLARVGGKYPHLWHVRHMENPRSTSPRSIMPPYPHLLTRDLDFDRIPGKLSALRTVGVPYEDAEIDAAVAEARAQAAQIAADVEAQGGPAGLEGKEIAALVAYLQKLGTFLDTSTLPAAAEDDLEPHELEEIQETMQDEQPGDLPGTDLEEEELPEGVEPTDVDMERTDSGSVVDDEAVDGLIDDGSTDDGQEAPDAP